MRRHIELMLAAFLVASCKGDPGPAAVLSLSALSTQLSGAPPGASITVSNTGTAVLNWSAGSGQAWLYADPSSGAIQPGSSQLVDVLADIGGLPAGTYTGTLQFTTNGGNTSVQVTMVVVTVELDNQLLNAVNVLVNGDATGSVPAQTVASQNFVPGSALLIEWQLVRSTTTGGTPIGDLNLGGTFSPVSNPSGTVSRVVDNVVGTSTYFIPYIDNSSGAGLLMVVNYGTAAENRCNCVVPAFSTDVQIGYYRYQSGGQIRAYASGSNYTGGYIYWDYLLSWIISGSGRMDLFNSLAPVSPGQRGAAPRTFAQAVSESVPAAAADSERPGTALSITGALPPFGDRPARRSVTSRSPD